MREFLDRYMPPNYSAHGGELDNLNTIVHWMMLILFIGWGLLFLFMLLRFNHKKHPRANYAGTTSHASTWVEGVIVLAEIVLLVGFSIPLWARWSTLPKPSENPLEIRVVGEQFAWNIHYPGPDNIFGRTSVDLVDAASNPLGLDTSDPHAQDDVITLNQLHLEVGRPVVVRLSSKDVIHSFSLPVMRVKQDAIPGMEIAVHFTPIATNEAPAAGSDKAEVWEIGCAQLCGLGHFRMKGMMTVHSKAGFDKWKSETKSYAASISG